MNNPSTLELLITENTVVQILNSLDPRPSIHSAKLPEITRRLRTLYAVAFTEHHRSPRNMRTVFDKSLNSLLKDIRSLQQKLSGDNVHRLNVPLELAALGLFIKMSAKDPLKSGANKSRYIAAADILQRIEQPLGELESLVNHLRMMIDEFDQLDPATQSVWFFGGKTKRDRYVRQELYPYFRKRGGVGPDTYVVYHMAKLYEYTFGKEFKINSLMGKPNYEQQRGAMHLSAENAKVHNTIIEKGAGEKALARYSGEGIRFACAVIKELKLQGLIAPLKVSDLHAKPSLKSLSEPDAESQYDLSELNRAFALQGDPISEARLVNKIGDIWTNNKKSKGLKSLHG